ncbi:YoaK family protein [Sphingomonas sp. FW199]|uniref:YoaK family protein n=1 Tax=Sphingomonas sp. FW199 TaxID=3400217 RepID=UPI003CEA6532
MGGARDPVIRLDPAERRIAILLAALAGYVDAVGFMASGGFFVSFMTGNSTRTGVGIAERMGDAAIAAMLIAAFVAGVTAGTLVRRWITRRSMLVALVALCVGIAAATARHWPVPATLAMLAFAMGAENAVLVVGGEAVSLTYMTGTLVKVGQRIGHALAGGDRWGWAPFAILWAGLILGAVAGGMAHHWLGIQALWPAALAALLIAVALFLRERVPERTAE